MILTDCDVNKTAVISAINLKDKEYLSRLYSLGLFIGAKVKVEFILKNKRASVVSLNGKAVILSSEITDCLEVLYE